MKVYVLYKDTGRGGLTPPLGVLTSEAAAAEWVRAGDAFDGHWGHFYEEMTLDVLANQPCPYTHAHSRNWCGRSGCRES